MTCSLRNIPSPFLTHIGCTWHYFMSFTEHYTVHCTRHITVHCTVSCTLQYTLHKHLSYVLILPYPCGKLSFLPLAYFCLTLLYDILYNAQYTVSNAQIFLHCTVSCTVHCTVSLAIKRGKSGGPIISGKLPFLPAFNVLHTLLFTVLYFMVHSNILYNEHYTILILYCKQDTFYTVFFIVLYTKLYTNTGWSDLTPKEQFTSCL